MQQYYLQALNLINNANEFFNISKIIDWINSDLQFIGNNRFFAADVYAIRDLSNTENIFDRLRDNKVIHLVDFLKNEVICITLHNNNNTFYIGILDEALNKQFYLFTINDFSTDLLQEINKFIHNDLNYLSIESLINFYRQHNNFKIIATKDLNSMKQYNNYHKLLYSLQIPAAFIDSIDNNKINFKKIQKNYKKIFKDLQYMLINKLINGFNKSAGTIDEQIYKNIAEQYVSKNYNRNKWGGLEQSLSRKLCRVFSLDKFKITKYIVKLLELNAKFSQTAQQANSTSNYSKDCLNLLVKNFAKMPYNLSTSSTNTTVAEKPADKQKNLEPA